MDWITKLFSPVQIKAFKALLAALLAAAQMLFVIAFDPPVTPAGQALDLTGYQLVFEDEFDAGTLDLTKWSYRGSGARRSGFNSPGQVSVRDGNLVIKAEYKAEGEYGAGWYAGMIRSVEEYTRGYFEIRCICSQGGGFWSAFWLNSRGMGSEEASNGGIGGAEVDIFEAFNYTSPVGKNSVSMNIHVGGYGDGLKSQRLGNFKVSEPYTQYNVYGLEWNENEYIFYINGVEATRSAFKDGVSQAPEYVILSEELPNLITSQPGFTTEFVVDYVKIYQKPTSN